MCLGDPTTLGPNDASVIEFSFESGAFAFSSTPNFAAIGPRGSGNAEPPAAANSKIVNATIPELGTVKFMGYHQSSNTVLVASYMKRYTGFPNGPNNTALGTIYAIDRDNNPNAPVSFFTANAGMDVHDYSAVHFNAPTFGDQAARDLVGFAGWNDIEVDNKNNVLYAINLHDDQIYYIPFTESGGTLTAGSASTISYPSSITSLCSGDDWRPGALKVYRDYVYTAVTCIALTSGDRADLHVYILRFPVGTPNPTFEQVIDFPLNYNRPHNIGGDFFFNWQAWVNGVNGPDINPRANFSSYPMPHTSDIEFDGQGNMLIGIADRKGDYDGTFSAWQRTYGIWWRSPEGYDR